MGDEMKGEEGRLVERIGEERVARPVVPEHSIAVSSASGSRERSGRESSHASRLQAGSMQTTDFEEVEIKPFYSEEHMLKVLGEWEAGQHTEEIPAEFICPLSLDLMVDPVTIASGHTYERSYIVQWLLKHNKCPATNQELAHKKIVANHAAKRIIQMWCLMNDMQLPDQTDVAKDVELAIQSGAAAAKAEGGRRQVQFRGQRIENFRALMGQRHAAAAGQGGVGTSSAMRRSPMEPLGGLPLTSGDPGLHLQSDERFRLETQEAIRRSMMEGTDSAASSPPPGILRTLPGGSGGSGTAAGHPTRSSSGRTAESSRGSSARGRSASPFRVNAGGHARSPAGPSPTVDSASTGGGKAGASVNIGAAHEFPRELSFDPSGIHGEHSAAVPLASRQRSVSPSPVPDLHRAIASAGKKPETTRLSPTDRFRRVGADVARATSTMAPSSGGAGRVAAELASGTRSMHRDSDAHGGRTGRRVDASPEPGTRRGERTPVRQRAEKAGVRSVTPNPNRPPKESAPMSSHPPKEVAHRELHHKDLLHPDHIALQGRGGAVRDLSPANARRKARDVSPAPAVHRADPPAQPAAPAAEKDKKEKFGGFFLGRHRRSMSHGDSVFNDLEKKQPTPTVAKSPPPPSVSSDEGSAEEPSSHEVRLQLLKAGTTRGKDKIGAIECLRKYSKMSSNVRVTMGKLGAVRVLLQVVRDKEEGTLVNALLAVLNLTLEESLKNSLIEAGGIDILVEQLAGPANPMVLEATVGAICNMCVEGESRVAMWKAGVIPWMVHILGYGDSTRMRREASLALFNLSLEDACRDEIVNAWCLEVLLDILRGGELPAETEESMVFLLAGLAKSTIGQEKLVKLGGPQLLSRKFLGKGNRKTQSHVVAALLLVAGGSAEGLAAVQKCVDSSVLADIVVHGSKRGQSKASALLQLYEKVPTEAE
eukprot:TRINITY_DN2075_c0_g5_i1.p1 TRINITY_DN2075_c0_g5~~TRINITY_DN2075_c0_g5_i1.p1  ORF type:complete len:935 (+),score=144.13 TRINITY_DN2075_c0_g5_i1:1152-3956(+)